MQFDFSALDAELESLGRPPEDALALARRYAPVGCGVAASDAASGAGLTLDEIDRTLAALEGDNGELGDAAALTWQAVTRYEGSPSSGARLLESVPPEPSAPASIAPASTAPVSIAPASIAPASIAPAPVAPVSTFFEEPMLEESIEAAPAAAPQPEPWLLESQPPAAEPSAPASVPPAASERPAALTQSQEIVLPDPIARDELSSESGELRLDGDDPSSGSFELPEALAETATEPRIHAEQVAPAGAARDGAAGDAPSDVAGASREVAPLMPFDEVQDALEGSQPLMLDNARGAGRNSFSDRDPDAEFDALLSEATDPRGIPTGVRGTSSGEVDADDLLRGLEGDLADEEVSADELAAAEAEEPHEAELLTRSLFEDAGEATEITDRAKLGSRDGAFAAEAVRPAPAQAAEAEVALDDELDELELVMDEDDDSATIAPPAAQLSKGPPPPPPPGTEKRPSVLGRLFNKREDE